MLKIRALSLATLVMLCCWGAHTAAKADELAVAAAAASAASAANDASSAARRAVDAASSASASATTAAKAASAANGSAPGLSPVPIATILFVVVFFLAGVLKSVRALNKKPHWLVHALSEKNPPKATGTAADADKEGGAANAANQLPAGSTSRLIAFLGGLAMLALYMGLGLYALWALFNGRSSEVKDSMQAVSRFLLYGAAVYAPYAFNQVKAAFQS